MISGINDGIRAFLYKNKMIHEIDRLEKLMDGSGKRPRHPDANESQVFNPVGIVVNC